MLHLALSLLLFAAPGGKAVRAPKKSAAIECTHSDSEAKVSYTVPQLKQALARVQKTLTKRALSVLDLSDELQERRKRLPSDVQAQDWCVVANHLRAFDEAVAATAVGEPFVTEKFARVERWVRSGLYNPTASAAAQSHISAAAESMSSGKWPAANDKLNKAQLALLELRTLWDVPAVLPRDTLAQAAGRPPVQIDPEDIEKSCPEIARRGRVQASELEAVLGKLAAAMKERHVRPSDVTGGRELLEDLRAYRRLAALWPATRAACALLTRLRDVTVDLGLVMGRFNRVTELRDKQGIAPAIEQRFKELVRAASDAIAAQKYEEANQSLDELLVLLGEAKDPATALEAL